MGMIGRQYSQGPRAQAGILGLLVLFITAVSVHDAVLVLMNEDVIAQEERNPVGRWLIAQGGGGAWLFVAVKLLGTAFVGAVLLALYRTRPSAALSVAAGLACFQLGLLLYLSLG
jgi:hypothetical protein